MKPHGSIQVFRKWSAMHIDPVLKWQENFLDSSPNTKTRMLALLLLSISSSYTTLETTTHNNKYLAP
jgi:hypothetical protein